MRSDAARSLLLVVLGVASCEDAPTAGIPTFADGGLLRAGAALTRAQLETFEGMFAVGDGRDLLGSEIALRTSPGTVSLLTNESAGFSVLGAACLPDRRVVLEGYWQYPTRAEGGLVRLFVEPAELALALCRGEMPKAPAGLRLSGSYGEEDDVPAAPLTLSWARELKPWRGRFFTVAHHGACEITDHCGATPNSLESIRLAERTGSNAAEVDVRVTRDGVPILFHDPALSAALVKGVFCNGNVADLSLADIRGSCALRYGETIPTLEEGLDMMVAETELEGVYLDVKVPDAVLPSARLAARTLARVAQGGERRFQILVAIPTTDVLDAWRAAKPALAAEGLAVPPCLVEFDPDLVLSEGCVAWGPTWTNGPRVHDVERVKAAGAGVVFWTINQSEFVDAFLTMAKPNGIITSRAALVFHRYQSIGTPPTAREEDGGAP